jgi:hypothetical protein
MANELVRYGPADSPTESGVSAAVARGRARLEPTG